MAASPSNTPNLTTRRLTPPPSSAGPDAIPAPTGNERLKLLDAATAPTLLEAALRYHALGFTVLPILKGQKKSGLPGWQDLRSTDADLRGFYRTGKYGGVAIRPGALSQNLVMVDCDGERVYEAFCAQFPALVETYTERSGSGKGYHLFYQVGELPSPGTSKVNRKGIFDTDDLGFEVFYDTGAVVVAPSVHPSGNHYTVYKPLDVLRLGDLNQVITWALTLETKQERESKARKASTSAPTRIHTGTAAPHNGEIAPDLLSDIEQALGVQGYKRDGWSKPIRCVLAHHEHDDSNPAASWHKDKHIYSCLKCGVTDMLAHPLAEVLGFNPASYYEVSARSQSYVLPITPNNQYHIDADFTINVPMIDALPVESAALQSGVGTFKTGFATREMGRCAGKAWYVTHREKLAEQETERAQKEGVIVELYNELPKSELYRAPRLSACINTLVLYVKQTGEMPPAPDLLVIDEWSQFAEAILVGGTLEGDELHIADQLVRYLLSSAKRVLLMDAHFSAAALDYARSARPGLPLVVNTYKTPRGELNIVDQRARAEAVAVTAAMAGERVAFGSFGIDRGQANADQLADVLGSSEDVLFVHADNAGGERQRAFLTDPDSEAPKYKAIVYSPLIGTGYSIDQPIDTLVVLASQQQSAEDVRQFIGRFRNVRKTYVWLPNAQDVRETDAQAIADRLIAAAEQTAHPFIQDGRLLRSISPQARTYATHHAAIRAERNASMNDLRQRFVQLCAGSYTIHALSGDDAAARALMGARLADIDQRRRALALTAPSVDHEAFREKQDAGQVSELDHAGYIRWQIEHLTGLTINESRRDRLWTESKRKAARRYADTLDSIEALDAADLEQAQRDDPLHKREHRTKRRAITEAFLRPLVDASGELVEYSAADLETVYRPIIEAHADNLHQYFGWYRYRVNTAAGVIRLVLRRVGIQFNTDRRRVDGERVQFYRLDTDIYQAAVETARAIVAQRQAERQAAYEAQVAGVQKLQNIPTLSGFAISGQRQKPKPAPASAPGATGWAAHPAQFQKQFVEALLTPLGMGY